MRFNGKTILLAVTMGLAVLASQTLKAEPVSNEESTMNNEKTNQLAQRQQLATAKAWAIQINVTDIDAAIEFYTETLGLKILTRVYYPQVVALENDGGHILLYRVKNQSSRADRQYRTTVNFQVKSIATMTRRLRAAGAEIIDKSPQKNAIGHHLAIADPSGNMLHLMELDEKYGTVEEIRFFNIEMHIDDLSTAVEFYENVLGLAVTTKNYWPPILPLSCDDIDIVLHQSEEISPLEYPGSTGAYLVLQVDDIKQTVADLTRQGQKFEYVDIIEHAPVGQYTALRDPFGNIVELIQPVANPLDKARASRSENQAGTASGR